MTRIVALLLAVYCGHVMSADHFADSASRFDILTKWTNAVRGDRIFIPATPAATPALWTNAIIDDKGVQFIGAEIVDGTSGEDGSGTVIDLQYNVDQTGILQYSKADLTTRISRLNFRNGFTAVSLQGTNGANAYMRLDRLWVTNQSSWAFSINGAMGVGDHITMPWGQHQVPFAYMYAMTWGSNWYGDGSWAASNYFGSDQFWVWEDVALTNLSGFHLTTIDGFGGSRYVFRHSSLKRGSLDWHGTESGGRQRGGRAGEFYFNDFDSDVGAIATYIRSGVTLQWSNRLYGSGFAPGGSFHLLNFRNNAPQAPFSVDGNAAQGADGTNPWDVNRAGGPFLTGTAGVASVLTEIQEYTVTNSLPTAWTNNFYQYYTIQKKTGKVVTGITRSGATATVTCPSHGFTNTAKVSIWGADQSVYNTLLFSITVLDADTFTGTLIEASGATPATGTIYATHGQRYSVVTSNTSNTITFSISDQTTPSAYYDLQFAVGEQFELYLVDHAMDQPGRFGGGLVTGDTPVRPVGWNDQVTSANYQWGNFYGSTPVGFSVNRKKAQTIRTNEHYFDYTIPEGYVQLAYPHHLVIAMDGIPESPATTKTRITGKANGDRPMVRNVGKTITR